jgi:hypothetical protein
MTNADMPTAGHAPGDMAFERDPRYTDRSAVLADAQYARDLAIEALQNNRLELGAGFANLAVRASRYADRMPRYAGPRLTMTNVPLLGATRDEQPRESVWAAAHRQGHHQAMWVEKCELCPDEPRQCPDEHQPPHAAGSHPADCATCWKTSPPHDGPTGDGDADLERAETTIFDSVETANMPVPRSSRCQVKGVRRDGATVDITPCWGAIYFEQDAGVWRHVHAPLDADHTPIPRKTDVQ